MLESPFVNIVAIHRGKIEARDSGRYTIAQAYAFKPEPNRSDADPELVARHLKIIRKL